VDAASSLKATQASSRASFRGIGERRERAAAVVEVIPARIGIVDDREIGADDPLPRPVEAEHRTGGPGRMQLQARAVQSLDQETIDEQLAARADVDRLRRDRRHQEYRQNKQDGSKHHALNPLPVRIEYL